MSHESANQNNSWSAKLMFRTRLRNIRYEYFGYDCAFTRKRLRACKANIYFFVQNFRGPY